MTVQLEYRTWFLRHAGAVLIATFSAIVLLTMLLPFAYSFSRFSFVGVLFVEAILSSIYIASVVSVVLRKRGYPEATLQKYVMFGYLIGLIGFVYAVYLGSTFH